MPRLARFFSLCLLASSIVVPSSGAFGWGQDADIPLLVETPQYVLDEQGLRVPGYAISDTPGAPQLPVWTTAVEVPAGAGWSIVAVGSEEQLLYAPVLLPSVPVTELRRPGPVNGLSLETASAAVSVESRPDSSIYSADMFYPRQAVHAGTEGIARGKRLLPLKVYPFRYNPVTGAILYRPRIELTLHFTPHRAADGEAGIAAVTLAGDASHPGVSLRTTERGFYGVSYEALSAAGVPVADLNPGQLAMWHLGQPVDIDVTGAGDGTFGRGDAVVFYAEPYIGRYMTQNVYRLTWSGEPGERIETRSGAPALTQPPLTTIWQRARLEYDRSYYSTYVDLARDADHFFDRPLYALAGGPTAATTYTLTLVNAVPAGAAELSVGLHGGQALPDHDPDQSLALRLNATALGPYQWDGSITHVVRQTVPAANLVSGGNSLVLQASLGQLPGVSSYWVSPDWAELAYPAKAEATDNRLYMETVVGIEPPGTATPTPTVSPSPPARGPVYLPLIVKGTGASDAGTLRTASVGRWLATGGDVVAGGFTSSGIRVYDVSDATHPLLLTGVKETNSGGRYAVTFAGKAAASYYLVTDGALREPASVKLDAPSTLRSPNNNADYIAIVHRSLWDAVQPLLDHRIEEGLRVAKVDIQDVYDEFSGGGVDPEALRAFLSYAYHNWNAGGPRPQYVLLVGDGHYDFKGALRPDLPNLVPPYLLDIDPFIGETAADNRFVSVDSDTDFLPDMAIGRIPAKAPADVTAIVDKILAYEKGVAPGEWQERVVFVADDKADPAGNFHDMSEQTRAALPPPFASQTIYYDKSSAALATPAEMKTAIKSAFDQRALYLQWFGHASRTFWGKDKLWELNDPPKLAQNAILPLTASYSCWAGYFINVQGSPQYGGSEQSLSEAMLLAPYKSSLADFAPSGLHVGFSLVALDQELLNALFIGRVDRVGPAIDAAKLGYFGKANGALDLIDTQLLFGDPATRLKLP